MVVRNKCIDDPGTDKTFDHVAELWNRGFSQRQIALRLEIGYQKVRKILLTLGAIDTQEARLFAEGFSLEQIAEATGKAVKTVSGRVPYIKGSYNADPPTANALRIRACHERRSAEGGD